MQNLSQRDSRWKDIKIGKSNSTIGSYGCVLTCLAMLSDTTPDIVNSKLKAVNGFLEDKIIWTAINKTDLLIRFPDMGRAYSYDNEKVKQAIEKNGGCLVEVDFDGVISTPNDRHWILYIGDGRALDPWTGKNIPTDTYPIVKGFCIINKIQSSIIEDMTEEQKTLLGFITDNGLSEGDLRWLVDLKKNQTVPNLEKKIGDLESSLKDLTSRLEILESENKANNELILDWQSKYKSAKDNESNLQADIQTWKNRYENKCKETVDKYSGFQLLMLAIKSLLKK